MTIYDEMMEGAIDVHCHIDFEFSAKERKREPEFQWLPKAEAMGMRGVVLKSHWWPTVNVVPYILMSAQTKVGLWSSVALNITAGGPNPCVIEACAELGGKMVFLPTWSARNDVEIKGFSNRIKLYYKNHTQLENPNYYFLDDKGKLIPRGSEIIECCKAHDLTLGMGHVSWQESLAFIEAARDMGFNRIVINHAHSHIIAMPLDAMKQAADMGAFVEVCWNALAPGRMDSPELVQQLRAVGLRQVIASTDYFRPYSPNPAELFRMFLGMLHEGGLSKEEVKQVACTNPARLMGLE
jgi:Imidazolonepropionase and related amidohydrolases